MPSVQPSQRIGPQGEIAAITYRRMSWSWTQGVGKAASPSGKYARPRDPVNSGTADESHPLSVISRITAQR